MGPRAGHLLAVSPLAAAALLLAQLPNVLHAPVAVGVDWVPALGSQWHLRLDALSLLFALVTTIVGAVVVAYSAHYLGDDDRPGRYYATLLGFATGMTLLVLAGDALLLYVGWEITTLTSYGLIASRAEGRRAAERALLVTFGGGLALLGAVLLGAAHRGTLSLAALADPAEWSAGTLALFLVLLLVAAAAKSAQVPFHFWLPGAMVAPTPVSAYLHAAAMVTAGLYLLLRFAAPLATQPAVAAAVVVLGTVTSVFAAGAAMRRSDMKELLAYSTISQLGFMIALVGIGTPAAIAGVLVYLVAHATYKAALFLAAGVFDHEWDARTLPALAGSARQLPLTTGAVTCACLSMAGIIPTLGYVGKEEAFKGVLDASAGMALPVILGLGTGLALTVAYTLRLAVAPFRRPAAEAGSSSRVHVRPMAIGPAVLAIATVGIGVVAARLTPLIDAATHAALGRTPSEPLGLWHGVTPALLVSLTTLAVGAALFERWHARGWWRVLPPDLGTRVADAVGSRVRRAGSPVARWQSHPSPAVHLAVLLVVASAVVGVALLGLPPGTGGPSADSWPRAVVAVLIVGAAIPVARSQDRPAAVASLALVGFLVAAFFLLHGAPQLAVVQLLVDGLTVALAIFVLRRLPRRAPEVARLRRRAAGLVAAVGGFAFAGLSFFQRSALPSPASELYVDEARSSSSGNVVATIITEFRALDTLGETTVVAVAALGVAAVLQSGRQDR